MNDFLSFRNGNIDTNDTDTFLLIPSKHFPCLLSGSLTNITSSTCASTTCIRQPQQQTGLVTTIIYPFDGGFDALGEFGQSLGFGSSTPGFTGTYYVGNQSLSLSGPPQQQYVQIPFVNLAQKSFTIEAWLMIHNWVGLANDYGIFGQCDSNGNCLSISLRNGRFALSFDAMNPNNNTLMGATINQLNYWLHVAIVYDAVLQQQQIYLNGQIDAVSRGMIAPFAVTSTSAVTTIGRTISAAYGTTYLPA